MSAVETRLPSTTAWAVALAAAFGTIALAISRPVTVLGAFCGLAIAVTAHGFSGSHRRVALTAAVLPVVVLVAVGSIGALADLAGVALAIVGVVVGTTTGFVLGGHPSSWLLERAGSASLGASLVASGVALVALGIDAFDGLGSAASMVLWLPGSELFGLVLTLVVAGSAVVAGVVAVPPAMLTAPKRRLAYVRSRNALAWWLAIGTAAALVVLAMLAVLTRLVPPLAFLESWLTGSALVRATLVALTVGGVVVTLASAIVHVSWSQTEGRENAVVPVLAGAGCGVACSAILVGSGALTSEFVAGGASLSAGLVGALFGATAVVLGIGGFLVWIYAEERRSTQPLETTVLAPIALAAGSVVVAATVDIGDGGLEAARGGLGPFVALAAALFAFDVGRYGRALGREVGRGGVSRRPQLVRIGWSGVVAALAVPIAIFGVVLATVVAPTLSVPSTAGVVLGLCAVVVAAWLLTQE
ncbi:hypothetical protein D8Y22_01480 [Salinadaptatus halalkaliphilus]|uniref:Uncharacterized protein n=1 Tax=Salinadaptatus halalkaliphilus TaxID=2419781 RepID=A0A4S3TVT6_9EURY|nr:hypothetical protein [Salinadaptatus halalkaliphilus]THE66818.1 hypothetical protein D8Y22_01480 [Salinadaptatus halalkaliphilus]